MYRNLHRQSGGQWWRHPVHPQGSSPVQCRPTRVGAADRRDDAGVRRLHLPGRRWRHRRPVSQNRREFSYSQTGASGASQNCREFCCPLEVPAGWNPGFCSTSTWSSVGVQRHAGDQPAWPCDSVELIGTLYCHALGNCMSMECTRSMRGSWIMWKLVCKTAYTPERCNFIPIGKPGSNYTPARACLGESE